jgi:hypothetical protein
MAIKPEQLIPLLETQRQKVLLFLKRLQDGKVIKNEHVEFYDTNRCSGAMVQRIFDIAKNTLHTWVNNEGCPRNSDGSYSITNVYKWQIARVEARNEKPTGLKEQKLEQEIELLKARIDKERQTNIPRSLHETIMVSRAGSLRTFLEKTAMANAVHLAGKTVDEVRAQLYRLLQAAMEAYAGKGDNE